ncbi:MAG: hypothetical protein J6386_14990 [Candidatus Synoicihabitans palmerolidicus]|nr:hypothetical protein [Candidatus Synoicihabitans palmerolidicus]
MLRWRDLLLETLDRAETEDDQFTEFRRLIETWDEHAAVDAVGYRLLRAWRGKLKWMTLEPIFAACQRVNPEFNYWGLRTEAAL